MFPQYRVAFAVSLAVLLGVIVFLGRSSKPLANSKLKVSPKADVRHVEPSGISKATFKLDRSKKYDICTVGAGLSGTIFAERFANVLGKSVLVLDSRHHIGGNCYDLVDKSTGIVMNKYGPHLFRTNDERVWQYINHHPRAPKWLRYQHEERCWIGSRLLPVPVNAYMVNALFNLSIQTEDEMNAWLAEVRIPCPLSGCETAEQLIKSRVGEQLYKAIFYGYMVKKWNKEPSELTPEAAPRMPVYSSFDPRYFTAKYQVLPSEGYTAWFSALLDHPKIDIVLKTNFFDHRAHLKKVCRLIVYTGLIDSYFGESGLDRLEYRSIDFVKERYFYKRYVQAVSVVSYPSTTVEFTRSVEYRHFLNQEHTPHSIVVSERYTDGGDPYYPVPSRRNLDLYAKYKKLAEKAEASDSIVFVGQLANYKYFSMDEAIANAIELSMNVSKKLEWAGHLDISSWLKAPAPAPKTCPPSSKNWHPPNWRPFLETSKRMTVWDSGKTRSVCYGLRPRSVHSLVPRRVNNLTGPKNVSSASIAILLHGHFRKVDDNSQAVDNLQSMLKVFPKAKVFIQSWSVRQTSHSWRQGWAKKISAPVNEKLILAYYRIPKENFGGIVVESEKEQMPKIRKLYSPEELAGMVCSGISKPSFAPNVGWLQMWWSIVQASQLSLEGGQAFDAVLNLRHDAYKVFAEVIPSWKTLRDLVMKYLEEVGKAPTDVSCWIYHKDRLARSGIDSAWVMGAHSNYKLSAKWLYDYKAMQEITCHPKVYINQEELVPVSAVILL